MVTLNPVEARVLGALIEKEITTPEYYPLSLNALVNACNQKSNREPVMDLTESEVRTALFALDQIALVRTHAEGRVSKFEHRVRDVLNLRRDEVAVVCLLLLRGPQTPAELRTRSERLYTFDDNASVLTTLDRLAARRTPSGEADPMTILLPRQPGSREARWMHLLSGPPDEAIMAAAAPRARAESSSTASASAVNEELQQRVEALEEMVFTLEQRIFALEAAIGVTTPETE
jgi:uncharacterized protein YceH (UPF0502 family)